jgi:probable rRNA maturation factor
MISFSNVETDFKLKNKLKVRNWVRSILAQEGKRFGDISYVFCTDAYLLKMNIEYLKHDTLTDIITFDYSENGKLAGDIFISIERVIENAKSFSVSVDEELARVLAHGVLHLSGFKDKKPDDKKLMRTKEDFYLRLFPNL